MILTFLFWKSVAHFLTFIFSVAYQVIFSRLGTTFQDFNLFLRKSINPVFNKKRNDMKTETNYGHIVSVLYSVFLG